MFRDVDLDVEPGELVALTGPAGSGRTSLLLALAGAFRTTAGTRRMDGRAGIGFVPRINEPESGRTAGEHVRERLLLLGRNAADVLNMLRLALLGEPDLVVADDVDLGLSTVEREELWLALTDLRSGLRGHRHPARRRRSSPRIPNSRWRGTDGK